MTTIRAILSSFGTLGVIDIAAAFVVAIGCFGEFWIIANKLTAHVESIGKTAAFGWRLLAWIDSRMRPLLLRLKITRRKLSEAKEHLLERFFVLLVALGVAVEFVTLPFQMLEIAHLNVDAEIAKRQTEQIRRQNLELTIKLAETQKRIRWRTLDARFHEVISKSTKGSVEVIYKKDDAEAYNLASGLAIALDSAGWRVDGPKFIVPSENRPFMLSIAGMFGSNSPELAILVNTQDIFGMKDPSTPVGALSKAFQAVGIETMVGGGDEAIRPPAGTIRIVIGSRL